MADLRRRPWTDADNRALIDLWPRVGSIVLIALELERSSSSVQTQASRLGLPRRTEANDRHRRKWTAADVAALEESVARHRTPEGRIPICEVAEDVGRSIDAVAARLAETLGGEEELFSVILVTRRPTAAAKHAPNEERIDPRKVGRMRPCMTCRKMFWSEGAHNRRCMACKSNESDSAWDW
jgi:hypothetical protein